MNEDKNITTQTSQDAPKQPNQTPSNTPHTIFNEGEETRALKTSGTLPPDSE